MKKPQAIQSLDQPALKKLEDEQLMLAYQQGTAAAFDELYARHKGGLYRYLLRQLNHQPELASELFQEVWMKLINTRSTYEASARFTTFLYRLAYHRLVDHWRSEKPVSVSLEVDDNIDSQQAQPQTEMQREQVQQQLKQAIAELPPDQRHTILLKEEGALSLEQIAQVTGVNRETVKSRLRYASKRLRQLLQPLRSV